MHYLKISSIPSKNIDSSQPPILSSRHFSLSSSVFLLENNLQTLTNVSKSEKISKRKHSLQISLPVEIYDGIVPTNINNLVVENMTQSNIHTGIPFRNFDLPLSGFPFFSVKNVAKRQKKIPTNDNLLSISEIIFRTTNTWLNTSEISEMCHSTKEPIFITKNGYGDMVLMSMENYERMMKLSKVYKELEESESQIEAGQTMNARKQLGSMREKYGL